MKVNFSKLEQGRAPTKLLALCVKSSEYFTLFVLLNALKGKLRWRSRAGSRSARAKQIVIVISSFKGDNNPL
jgi:hypothetical protein